MAAALAALRADGYPLAVLWPLLATPGPGGNEEVRYARTL
jgi:hypothetical protein